MLTRVRVLVFKEPTGLVMCIPCSETKTLTQGCTAFSWLSSLGFVSPPFSDYQLFECALWNSGKVMGSPVCPLQTRDWGHRKASVPRKPTVSFLVS